MHSVKVALARARDRVGTRRRRRRIARHGAADAWQGALASEARFWEGWLGACGGPDAEQFRDRLDPERPLQPYVARFLPDTGPVRILDVGAGPMTFLGRVVPGREVELVATDALADEYRAQLDAAGIVVPVPTLTCETERLTDRWERDSFDVVHARNTIDHHRDPIRAIDEMVAVARPGGVVVLHHDVDEGEHEGYAGLHGWNISVRDGVATVWNPQTSVDLDAHLDAHAERVLTDPDVDGLLMLVYRKRTRAA